MELATDFVHVNCAVTLQRLYYLFVIEVGSRYVYVLDAIASPDGPWTTQQVRNPGYGPGRTRWGLPGS